MKNFIDFVIFIQFSIWIDVFSLQRNLSKCHRLYHCDMFVSVGSWDQYHKMWSGRWGFVPWFVLKKDVESICSPFSELMRFWLFLGWVFLIVKSRFSSLVCAFSFHQIFDDPFDNHNQLEWHSLTTSLCVCSFVMSFNHHLLFYED